VPNDFRARVAALFVFARTALGAELVLLDLKRQLAFIMSRDAATGDQVQKAFFVQLRRPTNGDFKARADRQVMIGSKQDAGAANVQCFAVTGHDFRALIERLVAQFTLDGEAA